MPKASARVVDRVLVEWYNRECRYDPLLSEVLLTEDTKETDAEEELSELERTMLENERKKKKQAEDRAERNRRTLRDYNL